MGVTTDPFTNAHANRNKGGGAGNIVCKSADVPVLPDVHPDKN